MANKPIKYYPGITPPVGYKLNPFSNNFIYCPDPKVINPLTGRCVNPDSKTLVKSKLTVNEKPVSSVNISVAPKILAKNSKSKKKQTIMQKVIKDYMIEIAEINKLAGKKASSYKSKSKSKSKNKRKARSI